MKYLKWNQRLIAGLLAAVLFISLMPTNMATATEETESQCACTPVEGVHDAACPLYAEPETAETTEPTEATESTEPQESAETTEVTEPAESTEPAETTEAPAEPESADATDPVVPETPATETATTETPVDETATTETPALFSTTRATGPTMTAALYADLAKTTKLADLTVDGTGTFTWNFVNGAQNVVGQSAVVYLWIECSNLNSYATTTVTLEMDQVVYVSSFEGDWELSSLNTSLEVNSTGSYVGGQWFESPTNPILKSGTYTYTSKNLEEFSIPVQLKFDPVLWNRQKGAELKIDDSKPLIKVTLESESTTTSLSVDNAKAGTAHKHLYRRGIKTYVDSPAGTTLDYRGPTGTIAGSTKDVVRFEIRSYDFYSKDYTAFYSEEFTIKLTLPTCTIDGVKRTMKFVKFVPSSAKTGKYECTYDEVSGVVTVTYHDVYCETNVMGQIYLEFPELLNLEQGTYVFKGDEKYYRDGLRVKRDASGTSSFQVTLDNTSGCKLLNKAGGRSVDDTMIAGAVSPIGFFSLENSGNDVSDALTVKMTFNSDDRPVLGVTTVNLMADVNQNPMVVTYTLMDENGNPVNEGKPYTISLSHNYTTAKTGMHITFSRLSLPADQRGYYFKTIEYTLTEIPGKFDYNNAASNLYTTSNAGVIYGRSLMSGISTTGKTLVQVFNANGEEQTALRGAINTNVTTVRNCSFHSDQLVLTTPTGAAEIYAGDTWGLRISALVTDYPYQHSTYIDGVRFAFRLPVGMVINESTVKAWLLNGTNVPIEKITCKTVETTDRGEENLWIVELASGYPIGYYRENLNTLSNNVRVSLSFQVNTSRALQDDLLQFPDRVYVAGDGYLCAGLTNTTDAFDMNENGSTTDLVGALSTAVSLKVNKIGDMLKESNDLTGTDGTAQNVIVLTSPDQQIAYSLNISNEAGGQASNLAYYIEIPQESFGGNTAGTEKLILSGAGTVNHISGTELTLLYTTASGLTAANAKEKDQNQEITWVESLTDYSTATMVKVVIKNSGEIFTNGSASEIALPLAYKGTEFSKVAGGSVEMNASASFVYSQGMAQASIFRETEMLTVTAHYTHPVHELTLTAALNGEPQYSGNVKADTYATGLSFYNVQDFTIQNVTVYNVNLGDYSQVELNADANQRFKITAQMNSTTVPVLQGQTIAQLSAGTALSFAFVLFNGNALTDITTQRYITFEIASDSVTIPVRININRELATIGEIATGIIAGKEYINAGSADKVSISQDSAFTAQFVIPNFNSTNYGAHKLTFSQRLPAGTTIAMIDYTAATPRYAYFRVNSSVSQIDLTQFKLMGTNTAYTITTLSNVVEKLLFVVDFSNATSYLAAGDYTITLNVASKVSGVAAVSSQLSFTTTAKRSFSISRTPATVNYGDKFTVSYEITSAANDSKYNGRMLTIVVTGDKLPADACLVSQSGTYYQNAKGQFIIPLTAAQVGPAAADSIDLELRSATLENSQTECNLTATLWISATASAEKPFKGSTVGSVNVKYVADTQPSLKVTKMSDRALNAGDLANFIEFIYTTANVPTGGYVTLEIQKQVDAGYVTDSIYLETVDGSSSVEQGVYTIPSTGKTLKLRFSGSLGSGNYQVMLRVKDANGNVLLSVPYRFIVTE